MRVVHPEWINCNLFAGPSSGIQPGQQCPGYCRGHRSGILSGELNICILWHGEPGSTPWHSLPDLCRSKSWALPHIRLKAHFLSSLRHTSQRGSHNSWCGVSTYILRASSTCPAKPLLLFSQWSAAPTIQNPGTTSTVVAQALAQAQASGDSSAAAQAIAESISQVIVRASWMSIISHHQSGDCESILNADMKFKQCQALKEVLIKYEK
jgi:hypothetical protein